MDVDKRESDSSPLGKSDASGAVFKTCSHTEIKVSKFCHTWTIRNFSFCSHKVGELLKSESFSDGINDEVKWYLHAFPKGTNEDLKDYVSLFLFFVSREKSQIMVKVELSILNAKREKTNSKKLDYTMNAEEDWGYRNFIERQVLFDQGNGLLPNDTLTIFCEVSVAGDTVNIRGMDSIPKFKDPERSLNENLGLMFDTQQFSDVTIVAGDQEFKAHKMILAAHSPVFAAMFKHKMEEQKQNRVDIIDVDGKVLEKMLRFMYTGKATNIETMADSLLVAADKYAIDSLKLMCQAPLCKSVTKENVSHILVLADLHNADWLKAQAINFINMHTADVLNSDSFKSTVISHPRIIAETLRVLAMWRSAQPDELALPAAK